MQTEGNGGPIQAEVGMPELTSKLAVLESTHVEVQQVELIKPMNTEHITFGSLAKKPITEAQMQPITAEQMPTQVSSASLTESIMVGGPTEPA